MLFLAANAAAKSDSALGQRYQARLREGWDEMRAKRDLARKILLIALAIWRKAAQYDDALVGELPDTAGAATTRK